MKTNMEYQKNIINKIINGDCLEVMKQLPDKSIDLVLTDPPYGINADKGFSGSTGFNGMGTKIERRQYFNVWDMERPSKAYFEEIIRISKLCIIFGGNYFCDLLPPSTHWLVWDKLNTMPTFSDCELLYTNSKRKSVMKYVCEWNGLIGKELSRIHPTQKPEKIIKMILSDYSNENDLILDCFSGSGTTAIACSELKRNFICIEKDKQYYEASCQRLDNYNKQLKLF